MTVKNLFPLFFLLFLNACAFNENGTIADLRNVNVDIVDTRIEGGLEKAMKSYQRFLQQTPESAMTPDAIRRLADLNVEKEYGVINEPKVQAVAKKEEPEKQEKNTHLEKKSSKAADTEPVIADVKSESTKNFEKRASASEKISSAKSAGVTPLPDGSKIDDLQTEGARKAIQLYKKLLEKFPMYQHKDQVLYQLSRAYEEVGQINPAMDVMNRLVREYPQSRHFAEVQFRRAEYYFTRKNY